MAGIIEGVCDGAAFPARVTAHSVGKPDDGEMWPGKTVFLVKFEPFVVEREGLSREGLIRRLLLSFAWPGVWGEGG